MNIPDDLAADLAAARDFELQVNQARDLGEVTLLESAEIYCRKWNESASRALADWINDNTHKVG